MRVTLLRKAEKTRRIAPQTGYGSVGIPFSKPTFFAAHSLPMLVPAFEPASMASGPGPGAVPE